MDGIDTLPPVAPPRPALRAAVVRPLLRLVVSVRSGSASAPAVDSVVHYDRRRERRRMLWQIARFLGVFFVALTFAIAVVAAPTAEDQVIVPSAQSVKPVAPTTGPGGGAFTAVAVIILAGAGVWLLWRARAGKLANLHRAGRQLEIEETRSLGNRQYLVVAAYQDKKFLLGVCPGRIDLLAPLHDGAATVPTKERS